MKSKIKIIKRIFSVLIIAVSIMLCAPPVKANEANYQQYVVGDRAAGMGGAGAALGTALDAAYYNPAGLAYTKQRTISVSASLYGWQRYQGDDVLYPTEDLKTSSFITVPPAMGVAFYAMPDLAIGLAAFVPYRYSLSDIIAFPKDNNYYNASIDDQTIMIGPSAAYRLSEKLSVGIGLYGTYRTYNALQTVYLNSLSYSGTKNIKYKTVNMLSSVGLQYRPTEHWRLGASAQIPSLSIWGNGEYEANDTVIDNKGDISRRFIHADNMDAHNRIPAKFTVGAGWEKEKTFGLGVDVTWHLANSYNRLSGTSDLKDEDVTAKYHNQAVVDVNIGAEYYIVEVYPIRAGFYTAMSSAPDVNIDKTDYPAKINEYGLTASIGRELQNVMMSIGVNYIFGSGNDFGYVLSPDKTDVTQAVTSCREKQLYIFFNTSYMF